MAKVLIVEDDDFTAEALEDSLALMKLVTEHVRSGDEALFRLRTYFYDLAILDINLPGRSGIEVCREYRREGGTAPILMLTARKDEHDKIAGLDCGADDYLIKPYSTGELNARVRALLRRPPAVSPDILRVGELTFNQTTRVATRSGETIVLQPRELAVLELFMRHPERIFTVPELLEKVWNSQSEATEEAVWQSIKRLRKSIDKDQTKSLIVTVRGIGYKLCLPSS